MFGGAPHGKSVNILPSLVPTAFLVMDTFLVVKGKGKISHTSWNLQLLFISKVQGMKLHDMKAHDTWHDIKIIITYFPNTFGNLIS